MATDNRWTALDTQFAALAKKASPMQVHRVGALQRFAANQELIEEAEYLLTVAKEIVALQERVDWISYEYVACREQLAKEHA